MLDMISAAILLSLVLLSKPIGIRSAYI